MLSFEDDLQKQLEKLPTLPVPQHALDNMWKRVEAERENQRSHFWRRNNSIRWLSAIAGAAAVVVLGLATTVYLQHSKFSGTPADTKTVQQQSTLVPSDYDVEFWPTTHHSITQGIGKNPEFFTVYVGQWKKSLEPGPVIVATTVRSGVETTARATTAEPGVSGESGSGPGGYTQAIRQYLQSQHLSPIRSNGQYVIFSYNKLAGVLPAQFNILANASQAVPVQDWRLAVMNVASAGGGKYRVQWAKIIKPRVNVALLQAVRGKLGQSAQGVMMPWYSISGNLGFAVVEYKQNKQPYLATIAASLQPDGTWKFQMVNPMLVSEQAKGKVESALKAPILPFSWSGNATSANGDVNYQCNGGLVDNSSVVKVRLTYRNGQTATALVKNGMYVQQRIWVKGQGQHQPVVKIDGLDRLGNVVFHLKEKYD